MDRLKSKIYKYETKTNNLLNHIRDLEKNNSTQQYNNEMYVHKRLLGDRTDVTLDISNILELMKQNKKNIYINNKNINIFNNNIIENNLNIGKSNIILFYSPRCIYCKKIFSTYIKFANILQKNTDIIIGIYNTDENILMPENDYSQYVNKIPTVLKIDKHSIELFNDEITLDNLIEFAEEHRNEYIPDDKIIELNNTNIDEYISYKNKNNLCLLFHKPTCPYCQEFYKLFEEFSKDLSDKDNYIVGHYNCDENNLDEIDIEIKDKIEGVPTLLKITNDGVYVFDQNRDKLHLNKFFK